MMTRDEALALADLVREYAPWTDGLFVLPTNPARQAAGAGPYRVLVSSGFLRVALSCWQDWANVVQQLHPTPGPTGLPLLDQRQFHAWVREQLARTDLDDQEQICSTGELELFVHDPLNHATRLPVPFKATMAPVVDGGEITQNAQAPTGQEIMLTVRWSCPICGYPLCLTKRIPTQPAYRVIASPLHPAIGTEKCCPENVWVEVEYSERAKGEDEEPLYVQVWQIVPRYATCGEMEGIPLCPKN